jgi:hypothetical protein
MLKMIKAITFVTILASHICVVPLFAQEGEVDGEVEELPKSYNDPSRQPLVRVMANPERFNGKVITVTGYFKRGTHINHLFLDMESCNHIDTVNSILLGWNLYEDDSVPCRRETVNGKLNHSPEKRFWVNDSDMTLEQLEAVNPEGN